LLCEGNGCRKNVTKFRPFLRRSNSSAGGHQAAVPISVVAYNDPGAEYKYLLKPVDDPPQIRVVVPGAPRSFA